MNLKKHGTLLLFLSTIGGLGFAFLGSVINSKMLGKEVFGDLKYVQSYLILSSYIIDFGFYTSGGRLIASSKDEKKIATYKGYMLYACFLGLIIMLVATLILGFWFQSILTKPLFNLLIVIFPLVSIHPLIFYFEAIFQAERKLISYSAYKIMPSLLYVVCLVVFKNWFTGSLFYNALLYYMTYFLVFFVFLAIDKIKFKLKSEELQTMLAENKNFGMHIYFGSLWNVGAGYLLPILVGYFSVNNTEVGYYSLALNFIIPLAFIPSVIGTSYYRAFIDAKIIPKKAIQSALLASVLLLIGTFLGIDFFLKTFLDARFEKVGDLVKIGAVAAIFHGFGDFINKFLSAKGEGKYIRNTAIVVGIVQLLGGIVLIKYFSSIGGIVTKSLGSTIYFVLLLIFYYKRYYKVEFKNES